MPMFVFNVPGLSPGPDRKELPPQLAYFPAGLPCPPSGDGDTPVAKNALRAKAREAEQRVGESLPLKPGDARAALDDMLRMGEEFSIGGLLKELAAHHHLLNIKDKWRGRPGEMADIAHFAKTGEPPARSGGVSVADWSAYSSDAGTATAADIRREMENCQKVLLLARSLEQREQELAELEQRYALLEASLHGLLREGQADDHSPEITVPSAPDKPDEPGEPNEPEQRAPFPEGGSLSWRAVVDAALPFLPDNAILFTNDNNMALDMRDSGMLQPLPEDKAALCAGWPAELLAGLMHACLPAWRLVGRRGSSPARPWLDREVEVLVARPRDGWAASPASDAATI